MLFLAFVINVLKLKQMLATQRKYAVQSFEIVLFLVKCLLQKFHIFRNFSKFGNKKEHKFFFLLYSLTKFFYLSYCVYAHDAFDIAEPSSMQDAHHMHLSEPVIPLTHHRVLNTTPYGDSESFIFALLLTK